MMNANALMQMGMWLAALVLAWAVLQAMFPCEGRYEGLTDQQQLFIDTEVFKRYKFFGRPHCSPDMKDTGKYNYKVCKKRQKKYDIQAKSILKKWISWNKNRRAKPTGLLGGEVGCNTDGLDNRQVNDLIKSLKGKTCYRSPKKGILHLFDRPKEYPACECQEGTYKNYHGVPVCSGAGHCK